MASESTSAGTVNVSDDPVKLNVTVQLLPAHTGEGEANAGAGSHPTANAHNKPAPADNAMSVRLSRILGRTATAWWTATARGWTLEIARVVVQGTV